MASLRFLFHLLLCQAAVLVVGKYQWLFVQELLSSLPEDLWAVCPGKGISFKAISQGPRIAVFR